MKDRDIKQENGEHLKSSKEGNIGESRKTTDRVKQLIFFLIGATLFYFVYKDFDISTLISEGASSINYYWIALSLCLAIASHLLRALRWNLILDTPQSDSSSHPKSSKIDSFLAVMSGYFINLLIPRAGEISRCGLMARSEKRSMIEMVGTVVQERFIDIIMLGLITSLSLILSYEDISRNLLSTININDKVKSLNNIPLLIAVAVVTILTISYILYKKRSIFIKYLKEFINGLSSLIKLEQKGLYALYSIGIWALYFLMNYICFFSLEATSALTPTVGLVVFIFGSFAMLAPVQGGIGAWHYMTITALSIYGISESDGMLFAFIVHSSMNLMLLVVGALSFIIISIKTKNRAER